MSEELNLFSFFRDQEDITLNAGYIEIRNSTTIPLGTTLKTEN